MEYRVIRSARKTVSLQLTGEGLIVRAPKRMSERDIRRFVEAHADWIAKHTAQLEQSMASMGQPLTEAELKQLKKQAKDCIPQRVAYFAPLVGVSYGTISIRCQKTRWGSCSSKGNLNFNCLLMLAPAETLDSVVVHELCHRRHMDHSAAFYAEVRRVFPGYDRAHAWLKANGTALLARAPRED